MSDTWLPSLITATPQAGFDLAVKMSRVGVKVTQPSDQVRSHLRAAYEQELGATDRCIACDRRPFSDRRGRQQLVAVVSRSWRWAELGGVNSPLTITAPL